MSRVKHSLATNPIRVARELHGKTLQEFSDACGIHLQALYLNESGVYPSILPSVLNYLTKKLGLNKELLIDEYSKFISLKREEFFEMHAPYRLPSPTLALSPIQSWRDSLGLSRAALAKSLCVQPSILYRVETGKTRNLPEQLKFALIQAKFPKDLLEELEYQVEEFYYAC